MPDLRGNPSPDAIRKAVNDARALAHKAKEPIVSRPLTESRPTIHYPTAREEDLANAVLTLAAAFDAIEARIARVK